MAGDDADGVVPILKEILKMDFLTHTDFIASTLWPNNPVRGTQPYPTHASPSTPPHPRLPTHASPPAPPHPHLPPRLVTSPRQ